jgi:hypothetical protein
MMENLETKKEMGYLCAFSAFQRAVESPGLVGLELKKHRLCQLGSDKVVCETLAGGASTVV